MVPTPVTPPDMPTPIGPFSYAILDDHTVYVSGALAVDDKWSVVGQGDVAVQTERAFEIVRNVLRAAGSSLEDVVKINVYLVDASHYRAMNDVRKRVFRSPYPASTVVVVKELVLPEALVEVEVIARRR